MRKLFVLGLIFTMLTSLFVGCNTDSVETSEEVLETTEVKEEIADSNEVDSSSSLPFEGVELTVMIGQDTTTDGFTELIELAREKLGIEFEVELMVGGIEGDNILKTRLASGDAADIIVYNSGSLLGALNPAEYLLDITDESFMDKVADSFKTTVAVDDVEYGIPYSTIMAGGMMYNKAIYKELNLEVPKTWNQFLLNCDIIRDAGTSAVIGTYGDAWTSQVLFLGDNYNVISENPNFATEFEAGNAKFASTPAGLNSFQKLVDIEPYLNLDYSVATLDDGVDMLATGQGAHWPMLSLVMTNISELYPEAIEDIGVFGIPGNDENDLGLTVWMPAALYINKNSEQIDASKAFFDLYISKEGLDAYTSAVPPLGAYVVEGYALPDDAMPIVKDDMQSYIDNGKTIPALEYLTPVKGPSAAAICQGAGSAQITALEAAEAYDADCLKQAIQLGLDWE